jgi:hypothetical protein
LPQRKQQTTLQVCVRVPCVDFLLVSLKLPRTTYCSTPALCRCNPLAACSSRPLRLLLRYVGFRSST